MLTHSITCRGVFLTTFPQLLILRPMSKWSSIITMYLGWVASDPDNLESTTAPPSLPLSVTFLKENVDSRNHMQRLLPNFLLCAKVNPTFLHANIWTHVQIVQHQVESQPVAYYWEELCVSGKHSWSSFLFEWLMQGAEPRHWREPYWLSQMQFYLFANINN